MAPAVREPLLGYHPCSTGFLTCARDPGGGQCQAGSLTGAVASESIGGAQKISQDGWKPSRESKAEGGLDCDTDGWSRYESRLSDRWHNVGLPIAQRIKPGDNRLITPRVHIDGVVWHLDVGSSHPGAEQVQGLGCSPIKAVRELGSERRETVRSYPARAQDI